MPTENDPGFLPSRPKTENFENNSHGYVFGVKESNGDDEKILLLLEDLENQGQTPLWVTFSISVCKHDTNLISVSILTFSTSRMSNILKNQVVNGVISLTFGDLETSHQSHLLRITVSVRDSTTVAIKH